MHAPTRPCRPGHARELRPDQHQQGDVQRWRLVVGLIETRERIEHRAEHTIGRRTFEGEAQGEQREARDCKALRGQQAQRVTIDFARRAAAQEGEAVQGVDGPIRDDGPGPKRNLPFPREIDGGLHTARRRQMIGPAIAQEEERPEQQQPRDRAPPGQGRGEFFRGAGGAHAACKGLKRRADARVRPRRCPIRRCVVRASRSPRRARVGPSRPGCAGA